MFLFKLLALFIRQNLLKMELGLPGGNLLNIQKCHSHGLAPFPGAMTTRNGK